MWCWKGRWVGRERPEVDSEEAADIRFRGVMICVEG
jgi:hypothetical protein